MRKQPNQLSEKMENLSGGSDSLSPEQPEGILQLIDRLETIVDQLVSGYALSTTNKSFLINQHTT